MKLKVLTPFTYKGEPVKKDQMIDVDPNQNIRNQQNASHNYQTFQMGWLNFPKPGKYKVNVSCVEGNTATASLKSISFTAIPELPLRENAVIPN